jgi:hypothetical protein
MKPNMPANLDQRRASARRTALILGAVAVLLFVFSFIEVVRHQ